MFPYQRLVYELNRLILILVSLVDFVQERRSIDLELRLFIGYLASILIFSDGGVPFHRKYEFKVGWTLVEEKFTQFNACWCRR